MKGEHPKLRARSLIALLAAALALAGLALVPTTRAASPATFHVTLGAASPDMALMGMAFYPNALTVHRGDVLVFTNYIAEPHTVTFGVDHPIGFEELLAFFVPQNLSGPGTATFTDSGILNSGILVAGGPFGNSLTVTIDAGTGTYAFRCALHPLMVGSVTVVADGQALPKRDAQYQVLARGAMARDLGKAAGIAAQSLAAAIRAADIGGTGIEVAVGGGNGVSTVMRFLPSDITVHVGDTVHFVNRDPYTPHTVTFGEEPPGGDVGLIAPANRSYPFDTPTSYDGSFDLNSGFLLSFLPWGNTFSVTFTAPGTYPYICGLHDEMGMVGSVTVVA